MQMQAADDFLTSFDFISQISPAQSQVVAQSDQKRQKMIIDRQQVGKSPLQQKGNLRLI
jgi:hypothetical protein